MALRSVNQLADWTPDARGRAVLSAIISEHLRTGQPVGSQTIAERMQSLARWSPATIRNVMGELEEAGLLEQPHTSAGRVPTDKGYRLYVDQLTGGAKLKRADIATIDRQLRLANSEGGATPKRLMERASHLLSELSENVGIVISPPLADKRLQRVQFLKLADERILVVLVFTSGLVEDRVIRIDEPLEQRELEQAARYLNAEFAGKSLQSIRDELLSLMREEKALYDRLLRSVVLICERSLNDEDDDAGDVYLDGASNIIAKPDFGDLERLRELFKTFEAKSHLVKILNEYMAREPVFGDVHVVIGREHSAPPLRACTLITAPYRVGGGEVAGSISVVGPMRMEYERTMAVVGYIAQIFERALREESALI